MRYEDASHTGAFQGSQPIANDDLDSLPAGSRTPATGNLITGEGTQTGSAGADSAAGAHVAAIAGKGGEDTSFSGGKLSVTGEFGRLSVDHDGNYSYQATAGVENVRDRFTYTLADNNGATDTGSLIVEIGKTPVVIKANAQQIVPGPDGVVTLPPGVELSDIRVVGRNLVIDMPDGTQLIIIDGAVFVPQLQLGGVEVPSTNLAALLIGQEPQPAAGEVTPSSGGNFDVPVPPLDPGFPLGDLIPPTVYTYVPPEPQEVLDQLDREPEITIQPDGQPAAVNAVDVVDEDGLPTRNGGEPAGSDEGADGNPANNSDPDETTAGTIIINSPDGVDGVTINNVLVTGVIGQVIPGAFGNLTITGFSGDNILYSYTLTDNTSGDTTHDDFLVVLTDDDGDTDSATLRIDIIDDVPTARPDTDNVGIGGFLATGNVMTDASLGDLGDSDTNAADTVGADNASVTSISGAGGSDSTFDAGNLTVNGQYGVLTMQADGSYVYVRNQGSQGGVQDVFNYTLTDGDGDTSTTTLTISIPDTPMTAQFRIGITFDDDAQAGGIPGGVGDVDPDIKFTSGTVNVSGGDGALTFALLATGEPSGFDYVLSNGDLLIQQGGVTVIIVTLDANTGEYTIEQIAAIDHPAGGNENNVEFSISVRVTDADGDFVEGSGLLFVNDDSPTMNFADVSFPQLLVDETNLAVNDSADFSVIFNGAYGADGPGSTSYAVSVVNGTDSGLVDVATGDPILLFNNGGVVEGRVGGQAGAVAFTVSVNSATGVVTLDQVRALEHPDAADPDDPVSPNADSIQLTATIIDHDGDPASLAANIGGSLVFEDDGPSVSPTGAEPQLIVDESNLTVNATQNFGDAFNELFGADGPASSNSVSYALGINAGATGLVDTLSNEAVVLSLNGGVVEGRTEIGGDLVFTISVNAAGDVTVDQLRAVVHADPTDPDDSISLANDDLITLTATATDGDGDTASATIGIGSNVHLEDDGPSIAASGQQPDLTVDETNLASNATANFAGIFTADFGADGPKDVDDNDVPDADAISYDLVISAPGANSGLVDTLSGEAVLLFLNGGVVEGRTASGNDLVFTISADSAGNVTLDQLRAVVHPDPNNPDDSISLASDDLIQLVATITDGDGDTDTASANIGLNFHFEDDGPSISASSQQATLTVDETNLGNNASASFAGVFTSSFGADGAGTISYALGISAPGADSGLIDVATGQPVVLVLNGGVVEGHVGTAAGALAFTVSIDSNSGVVTLDQIRALQHPDPNNADDSVTLSADSLVTVTATITDRDGDQQSATANIGQNLNFEDDGPTISLSGTQANLTVDETILATNDTQSFASAFTSAFGADGAGTVTYALNVLSAGVNSGLVDTLSGQPIILVKNGAVIEGHVGNALGAIAFTVSVDASGNVTLDQQRAVVHPNPLNPDDSITLNADNLISLTATVTDKDGDSQSATLNIGQNLNFEDDGPSAINDSDTVPSGGNTATGNVITGIGTDGGVATADNPGADLPGHITAIQGADGTDTTFSGGLLSIHGSHGTLAIDADGNYTYTRDPGAPGTVQDVFTYTLTDADGDSTTATLTINISDAAPNPPAPVTVLLDDDALAGGIAGGPGDRTPDTQNTSGNLVATGGDGDLDYFIAASQTLPTGFTSSLTSLAGVQTLQISQNGTLVITVTLVNETGAYTVIQNAPIMHALDGNTEGEIPVGNILSAINVNVFAQDADGDQSGNAIISISVDDDTPTVSASTTQPSLTVDETVLATNASADFSGVFTHAFGADGPAAAGSVTYALGFNAGATGLVDVATGQAIVLVLNGGVVEGHVGNAAGALAFTVSVNAAGTVTLDQIRALQHPNASDPDDSVSLASDNLITLTQTVTDKDGDQASATANIGQNLNFEDDGPSAAIVTTGQAVSVDESVGVQIDSNDTTNAGVIALFSGVANKGVDTDLPQYATNASAIVASTGTTLGADGAGATAFGLNVSSAGVDSGLNTTDGSDIFLFKEGALVVGRVGGPGGAAAFAIAIDPVSGQISMVEYLSIQHSNPANADDSVSITNGAVLAVVTATDRDGDVSTAQTAIGNLISFQDSGPIMTAASNINIQNSGDVAHTGNFAFSLGADGPPTSNDVIKTVVGSATVNGSAVQNYVLTPGVENATTASYTFSFDYSTGTGTAHETGTLVFNKAAGTYTVDLADPILGFSILQTATGTLFQGYELGTSTPDSSQPAISVTQIQGTPGTPLPTDLFIQFTSVSEPSSGTGANNLRTINYDPDPDAPNPSPQLPAPGAWVAGELFNQVAGWVSTSNTANGTDGDTIQGGEVLDFNIVKGANPTGILAQPADLGQATTLFLKFDGIGASEDMIVVLKLYDPNTNTYTTRAVMIENADIQKGPGSGPGAFSGVTLDNNDGLVIIESNDYNNPGENWVIVGAQIAGSDEDVTGTAINLNGAIGAAGDSDADNNGSLDTQSFATDVDNGPFKISSIGILSQTTTAQNAHLTFDVTVQDGDGDSITQTITADVTAAADSSTPIALSAAVTTVVPAVLDLDGDGAEFLGLNAGVHYNYGNGSTATAWAGPDDGILVHDANGNGTVDGASEFVFGANGVTDLQALAAQYGSALDANDADYAKFGVWQDANSNGAVDAGEYSTLANAGIASINLVSDGQAYSAAGGDVEVAGSAIFTRTDGSTGAVADAAFLTGSRVDEQRALNSSSSNIALAAAVAAAGLAESHAALAQDNGGQHHQAEDTSSTVGQEVAASVSTDSDSSISALANETKEAADDTVPAASSSNSSSAPEESGHSLDDNSAHAEAQSSDAPAANDQGPASSSVEASPAAMTVGMPSAEALQAAGVAGDAQHGGSVEQIVADALGQGNASATVDALLNALPGGNGSVGALANVASPDANAVPGWDMSGSGAFGNGHDMMMNAHVAMHHDAIQPIANG